MNFQEYIINKGWKRYYMDYFNRNNPKKVYSNSNSVSTYGPCHYEFEHTDFPDVILWWGLHFKGKPAIFCLNRINIIHEEKRREDQDLWHDVMTMLDFDSIYNLILTEGTVSIKNKSIEIL